MSGLNQNPFHKKFTCPYCGEPLRTRQGLSGHIQFKHKFSLGNVGYMDKLISWQWKTKLWEMSAKEKNFPEGIAELGKEILYRWKILIGYFDVLGIDLNDRDFKYFFIRNFGIENLSSTD